MKVVKAPVVDSAAKGCWSAIA